MSNKSRIVLLGSSNSGMLNPELFNEPPVKLAPGLTFFTFPPLLSKLILPRGTELKFSLDRLAPDLIILIIGNGSKSIP